jgi:hypothetical protein
MADAGDKCVERRFGSDKGKGVFIKKFVADEDRVVVIE